MRLGLLLCPQLTLMDESRLWRGSATPPRGWATPKERIWTETSLVSCQIFVCATEVWDREKWLLQLFPVYHVVCWCFFFKVMHLSMRWKPNQRPKRWWTWLWRRATLSLWPLMEAPSWLPTPMISLSSLVTPLCSLFKIRHLQHSIYLLSKMDKNTSSIFFPPQLDNIKLYYKYIWVKLSKRPEAFFKSRP